VARTARWSVSIGRRLHGWVHREVLALVEGSDRASLSDVPPWLSVGRLETLLDVLESGRRRKRAVVLRMSRREIGTLHAVLAPLAAAWDSEGSEGVRPPSGTARAVRRRLTGLLVAE